MRGPASIRSDIGAFAELCARFDHPFSDPVRLLSGAGLTPVEWSELRAYWRARLTQTDEPSAALLRAFGQAYATQWAEGPGERPADSAAKGAAAAAPPTPALPASATSTAVAIGPRAPTLCADPVRRAEVPSFLREQPRASLLQHGAPEGGSAPRANAAPLPLVAPAAPVGDAHPAHEEVDADVDETMFGASGVFGPALPFRNGTPRVDLPPAPRHPLLDEPPRDAADETMALSTLAHLALAEAAALPFAAVTTASAPASSHSLAASPVSQPPPVPPVPTDGELSVEQYASLCVDLADHPELESMTLARYRLDEQARRRLDAAWGRRFAMTPELRADFEQKCAVYREWISRPPRQPR